MEKNRLFRSRNKTIVILGVLVCLSVLLGFPVAAHAENASVVFGSDEYVNSSGAEFLVSVNIKTNQLVGAYRIQLSYDNKRLQYLYGATEVDEENGLLVLEGTGTGQTAGLRFMIRFEAISGGEAYLKVSDANISMRDSQTLLDITEQGIATIRLSGEDTAAIENVETQASESESEAAPEQTKNTGKKSPIVFNIYFMAIAGVLLLFSLIEFLLWFVLHLRHSSNEKKEKQAVFSSAEEDLVLMQVGSEVTALKRAEQELQYGLPVIRVEDVTMEFHLSSSNASGLKEYLIQLIKRQVTYRRLFALYHVSFEVYRGEIVGIIGTNGSGKSTLLKIVSGALKPTGGRVYVDRRKIQLLTLGTGFDMELTARENVYLNGSIIGYSKEFLDAHYDEIVAFAELGDFMEEKVKNFSSGMVSRLGFSIATAGDAAEILILDEVLSVGDEFFRKKSLKRVKEMIHGGSTVLMVSHSMATIMENCTKCVWIEQGALRMVGEPKVVCEAYREQI